MSAHVCPCVWSPNHMLLSLDLLLASRCIAASAKLPWMLRRPRRIGAGEDKAAVAVQGAEAEVLRKPLEVIMI